MITTVNHVSHVHSIRHRREHIAFEFNMTEISHLENGFAVNLAKYRRRRIQRDHRPIVSQRRYECHRCRRVNRRNCTPELIETPVARNVCAHVRTIGRSVYIYGLYGVDLVPFRLSLRVFLHLEARKSPRCGARKKTWNNVQLGRIDLRRVPVSSSRGNFSLPFTQSGFYCNRILYAKFVKGIFTIVRYKLVYEENIILEFIKELRDAKEIFCANTLFFRPPPRLLRSYGQFTNVRLVDTTLV